MTPKEGGLGQVARLPAAPRHGARFLDRLVLACVGVLTVAHAKPLAIAHRGASGYLPEHTLEAAAYAHALGADFIEQDVVMSKDDVLVVCHDIHVDLTTDVAQKFPRRHRADGRYYAADFTWDELQRLQVRERFNRATGQPVFPRRFPHQGGGFRLCSMEESIQLVRGLNRSTGRQAGVYPEIKDPAWHAREGKDPGVALLELLAKYGYRDAADPVFVQCFDPNELKRLRFERKTKLRLVQLIAAGDDADGVKSPVLRTAEGLKAIAGYAQGIGPPLGDVVKASPGAAGLKPTTLVRDAHAAGLLVHPYTVRADALPRGAASIADLVDFLFREAKVDGVFIDQPDEAVRRR